jgi:hypothetical protein
LPLDPVTLRRDVIEGGTGEHDIVLETKYEAPSDGEDPYRDYDIWVAGRMMELLKRVYPGHLWATEYNTLQRVAKIGLPLLMGVSNWMAINLRTHEMTQGLILASGGEILERYGLRRGRFQLAQFLEAREKHSALVVPSRKVPS